MRSFLAAIVMVPALLVLPPACGGGVSGKFGDKCEVACKPPPGPCATEDPDDYQEACVEATEGLTVACAQCVTENSGWSGHTCTCSGGNCSMSSFGTPGSGSSSGSTCDPVADTRCSGFIIEQPFWSSCRLICSTR